MLHKTCCCCVLVTILGLEATAEQSLSVMSFNILRASDRDKGPPKKWEIRRDLVVEVIRKHDPAVIGTQECKREQAEYLVHALPEYGWFGVGRDADGNGEHVAVFYKRDLIEPSETGTFWLSPEPDKPGSKGWDAGLPRIVTWARFQYVGGGPSFYFFNTHFSHVGATARLESARLIRERIDGLPVHTPVIVTGDFNANARTSEPWRTLTEGVLSDVRLLAKIKAGPETTAHRFRKLQRKKIHRIDWILVGGPVSVQRVDHDAFSRGGRYPSDHFPVVAKLTLHGALTE